jgi:hypothetical protein
MSITRELWISNLLEAASMMADQETQEQRWLAPDRYAWERPEDLLNDLDAYNLDLFIDEFASQFTGDQLDAAAHWKNRSTTFATRPQTISIQRRSWSIRGGSPFVKTREPSSRHFRTSGHHSKSRLMYF